jgi:hypothetical protein
MTQDAHWQDLYKAAMLELNPMELRVKIAVALEAMRVRDEELRQSPQPGSLEECRAIADAVHNLTVLKKVELRPSSPNRESAQIPQAREV